MDVYCFSDYCSPEKTFEIDCGNFYDLLWYLRNGVTTNDSINVQIRYDGATDFSCLYAKQSPPPDKSQNYSFYLLFTDGMSTLTQKVHLRRVQ